MQAQVSQWLEEGKIDIFIGYKNLDGHIIPHCFSSDNLNEIKDLRSGREHYALEKVATRIAAQDPDLKIGLLLARKCNQQALNVLYVWNQLDPERIEIIDDSNNAAESPEPGEGELPFKKLMGLSKTLIPEDLEGLSQAELFPRWMYEFSKCLKCYGCRNICPVCFCKECSLEHKELVGPGMLPPEIPIFHLVRASHMAGRCIDCGLCEEACPADIPLRLLYRKVGEIVNDLFTYETGESHELSPFSMLGDKVTLEPKPI